MQDSEYADRLQTRRRILTAKDRHWGVRLDSQICFPLYAVSKEIIRRYRPFLEKLGLTYTQYIVMMVLWEKESETLHGLGEQLFLDSGTLTPVLKKMEAKGLIERKRLPDDERSLLVSITPQGRALEDEAHNQAMQMRTCIAVSEEDRSALKNIIYPILRRFAEEDSQPFSP